MNILGYMQQIGRALMVPVAVLPAAAILMGVGYWIDPNAWGGGSQLAAFLIKAGSAVIDNMALLFAVGVAYGMSKDKDGAAALSGLVGWLVVTTLLSPTAVEQITGEVAHAAFAKIDNQFIGILVGIISAELYNKFSNVELHNALAFFSGRRFVPIVVSIVMMIVSFALMYLWPLIYANLLSFGETVSGLGDFGAGLYGFFNRLLIPVGLHHALNSVFWFDVAGINDIPNFLAGQQTIVEFAAEGKTAVGTVGMYQAGFFPIMMFGLPGAALAIYMSARKENKEKVASIMIAAALASFFTGVTEPLEFSFMFVAPLLYFVHALLTGISVYIAAHMEWMAGFGFSAGFVDMVLSSKNPLAKQWYMLLAQGVVFFGIYYFTFMGLIKKLNLKTPGREQEATLIHQDEPKKGNDLAKAYVKALGGIKNIETIDACITRLRLTLTDRTKIKEADMKALGAMGVVKLGENNLQVIIGPQAESIADAMKEIK
ncbi:N-acetylglucosamine-specific PTS transporter subunit IIBC [Psychromonas algicola]|uniref:N-acetylglucosamine-specific PTS transporter subunit IIBC n=1 Tax=Psychromonas algicola TaxID=2555642 RepID=UPI0010682DBA|nr:N-acetylglucosamine-specific PTS transporter subunit IIBC [Psychromonas sp. RZ5]TEW50680.1 PTS glucose transporter subunit IIBC [Psychromonas sp. RZ5]